MKQQLHKNEIHSAQELDAKLHEIWNNNNFMAPHIVALINSMPRRIAECIKNGSGPVKY